MAYYKLGEHYHWFIARVVDIKDEERLGRVQIRVINSQVGNWHGKPRGTKGIEDEKLLWAWPISSIQSASLHWRKIKEIEEFDVPNWIDAVGLSPTGIAEGTYVFGFYLDGVEQNIPMIFGTYHKKSVFPEKPSEGGKLLQTSSEGEEFLYKDIAALAAGDYVDPITQQPVRGQSLPKDKSNSNYKYETNTMGLKPVDEPPTAYDAEYPYNTTYTTKSGHAIEIDDTPGHERIHIWHKSRSYEEVANIPRVAKDYDKNYPDGAKEYVYETVGGSKEPAYEGRRVQKTTGNKFTVVLRDDNILIQRDMNGEVANTVTIFVGNSTFISTQNNYFNTTGNNTYYTVGNNYTLGVGNNSLITITEESQITVGSNSIVSVGEDSRVTIGKKSDVAVADQSTLTVGKDCIITVSGDCNIVGHKNVTVSAKQDLVLSSDKDVKIGAKGNIELNGSIISGTAAAAVELTGPVIKLNDQG